MMNFANIIRFGLVGLLWLALCYLFISRMTQVTLVSLFPLIASGVIIFVPMYKKYVKKDR